MAARKAGREHLQLCDVIDHPIWSYDRHKTLAYVTFVRRQCALYNTARLGTLLGKDYRKPVDINIKDFNQLFINITK